MKVFFLLVTLSVLPPMFSLKQPIRTRYSHIPSPYWLMPAKSSEKSHFSYGRKRYFALFLFTSQSHSFKDATEKRGMWDMIKSGYDELVSSVIRPMRAEYCISDLGHHQIIIEQTRANRMDLTLQNAANFALECSWWRPLARSQDTLCPSSCIVFLHGNSSCRLGALEIVTYAIPAGFSVFALDFAGSGMSQVISYSLLSKMS